MMAAGQLKVLVNRWQPARIELDFVGYDFSDQLMKCEVRAYRDAPTALISLGNAASPAEGISVTVTTTDDVPTSTVVIRINETTIEGLPFTNPRGTDLDLVWDLVIGSGSAKLRWLEGPVTVRGGSTQI